MPSPIQIAHRLRTFLLRALKVNTRGVKVMLFDGEGRLLLIRNSYGDRRNWLLPGGGIHRGETPPAAAAREVREEVGIQPADLLLFAIYFNEAEGKRDTIHLFTGTATGAPTVDEFEVSEARFFSLDALPPFTSAATRRRIAEYLGELRPSTGW